MTQTAPARRHIASAMVIGCLVTPLAASAQQVEVATTVAFTEGPTVDRDGSVYFTDIINQRIMKLGADGVLSTYREQSNAANGLLIDPQGRLIACEGAAFERPGVKVRGTPRVTRTDLKTGAGRDARRQLRRQAAGRAQRRDHRRPGPPVFHRAEWRRRLPHRRAGEDRADSRRARRPQSERHPDLARRPDAVPRRSQRDAGRSTADPPLRPPARRHRPQHAGALRLLARPQRRRDEHRQPGQPLRRGRDEPVARHRGNAGDEDRGLRNLSRWARC